MTGGNPISRGFNRQESSQPKKGENLDDFARQKLERDLIELQRLIDIHFEERIAEENDFGDLKERINNRKEKRAQQIQERARKQQERENQRKEDARKKAEEEEARRVAEENKRKEAMEFMSMNMACKPQRKMRGGKRELDREKKKKVLTERRKLLNIDHLSREKLMEKLKEIHDWLSFLEEDRLNLEQRAQEAQFDVKQLRLRVNDMSDKKQNKLNLRK